MPQKRIFFVLDLNFHVLVVHYWNPCFVFCHYWVAYHARLSLACSLARCSLSHLSLAMEDLISGVFFLYIL